MDSNRIMYNYMCIYIQSYSHKHIHPYTHIKNDKYM